ncbi:MAG: helix-turn-helix domain-containing protein [Lachnospiraceae bacterium]|nr:helix-turn-helix domain-containing protein [Lachnospiraceae bacterium]
MDFNKLLEEKNISKYKLSKESGVPYSTVCDISTGKSVLLKCSAETVLRISHVLGMTAEELVGDISYPATNTGKNSSESKEKDRNKPLKSDKNKTKNPKKDSGIEKKTKADGAAKKKAKKDSDTVKKSKKDSESDIKTKKKTETDNSSRKSLNKTKKEENLDPIKKAYLDKKAAREEAYKNYCDDLQSKIKEMGELNFLVSYLKNNEVSILYNLNRKKESKYLLALVDELCVKYNFPLCKEYDEIREDKDFL